VSLKYPKTKELLPVDNALKPIVRVSVPPTQPLHALDFTSQYPENTIIVESICVIFQTSAHPLHSSNTASKYLPTVVLNNLPLSVCVITKDGSDLFGAQVNKIDVRKIMKSFFG
jgi:hypothetical protein